MNISSTSNQLPNAYKTTINLYLYIIRAIHNSPCHRVQSLLFFSFLGLFFKFLAW